MDCEKFDNVMLDELYGELDELTSASAKRHLSGCARCAAQFAGMKATRRVAVLPLVEPPIDLEAKIFARVKEAQKVIPFRARAIKFVSLAGSWAMRPQTAMAAVFLLMVGSSVLFMRASSKNASQMRVSDEPGMPAPMSQAEDMPRSPLDYAAAASAHGTEPAKVARLSGNTATAPLTLDPAANEEQAKEKSLEARSGLADGDDLSKGSVGRFGLSNAGPTAGAPMAVPTTASPPMQQAGRGQVAPGAEAKKAASSDFDRGMAQYWDKKYDDAVKTLDGISGSPDAALWSARAVRDSKGCGAAVARFDDLLTRTWGTNAGYEATIDAAKCYESMARMDMARARWSKLLAIPQYAARAQNELDRLRPAVVKPAAPMRADEKANGY